MTGLLASVRSREEATLALEGGADLIDLKEPHRGALGALAPETAAELIRWIGGRRPVSATLGDLPMAPALVRAAAERMAASGADYIKVGLFPSPRSLACVRALEPLARRGCRLVAVLFADQAPDWAWLPEIAAAGFAGAMLDTADKTRGGLRTHLDEEALARFVDAARALGLTVGLAGSLTEEDIGPLKALAPDFLGFRGALCRQGARTGTLDPARFAAVRARLAAAG
ncbi:(5-formylfuran-3-yl)methyl phosphate synthase [Pelomicrobium sp.]|jgi:dihydroneopterin aldolase|uniref:(5-formylfuran-3-yl)methyl phosphate synthase n=1 Tax=Pelomicrobium sp. TaxID=2815319 RepID=UPI002FDCD1AA